MIKQTYSAVTNLQYIRADETAFSCLVKFDHAPFPLPFIATCEGVADHAMEIYQRGKAGDFGVIAPYSGTDMVVPVSITRRQCALQMLADGIISDTEALAMATLATPPALFSSLLNTLQETEKMQAFIDFAATQYERVSPTLTEMMNFIGKSSHDVDIFFQQAAQL